MVLEGRYIEQSSRPNFHSETVQRQKGKNKKAKDEKGIAQLEKRASEIMTKI